MKEYKLTKTKYREHAPIVTDDNAKKYNLTRVGTWTPDPNSQNGNEEQVSNIHYDDDRSETTSYLEYTANLDLPFHRLPIFDETKECDKRYWVRKCDCKKRIVPSGCMNTKCPACKDMVGKRRASKVSKRFYSRRKNITLLYTVFTIPPHLRHKYTNKKEWQLLRKKLWKLLKTCFGGAYGLEASHPCGDIDKTIFHPHFNFLWIQKDGFRPYIDVDDMREKVEELIGASKVNFKHKYSSKLKQIMHWCKYVTRIFPGCHQWSGPTRWYGQYPKVKKDKEKCVCPDCNKEYEFLGFIDSLLVDEFFASTDDRAPPWENNENIFNFSGRGII